MTERKMVRFTMRITPEQDYMLQQLVDNGYYPNKSEAARAALNQQFRPVDPEPDERIPERMPDDWRPKKPTRRPLESNGGRR